MTLSNHDDITQNPYDLLRPIFENLAGDTKALCACSLASNAFRQEAQRNLYRDVTPGMDPSAHLDFLRTVAASPTRLALFVYAYSAQGFITLPNKTVTKQALKAMCNLKRLDAALALMYDDYRKSLLDCAFGLERFEGNTFGEEADDIFERFFPGQNALRHLGIVCSDRTIRKIVDPQSPFVAKSCLHLVSVTGSWSMIKALLPGRKITTLCIFGFDRDIQNDETSFEPLALELKYIKSFSVSTSCWTNQSLPDCSVLHYFPCVTVLELTDFDFDENMNDLGEFFSLCATLSKLPALQRLILSGTDYKNLDPKEDQQFIRGVLENAGNSLTCIDLQITWQIYTWYTPNAMEEISEWEARKVWTVEPI